jgi:hypothetical protein
MCGFATRLLTIGWSLPLGLAVLGVTPALAQYSAPNPGGPAMAAKHGGSTGVKAEPAPPPVLPGTKGASEAAEPTQSAADMSPTEALFDAVNRGDLPTARDAVNRGANMDGVNLLGLTPLDLSIDLGRNDISFMLLSMRGEDTSLRRGPPKPTQEAARRGSTPVRATRQRMADASSQEAPEEPVSAPRTFSGNGGAPIPAAGFLGFDGGRSIR